MYFKTEGLVLRETDYKDSDKLLTVLSKDRGQITLRARGVKSRNNKLKAGCQLLAYSEFTVFQGRGGMTVDEAVLIEMFPRVRDDIELLSLASYFAQVCEYLSQEDEPNPSLLLLCLTAIMTLSRKCRPNLLVKAAFELRAACLAGYEPMLDCCSICGEEDADRFCISSGVLQCSRCNKISDNDLRLPINQGALSAMRYITCCEIKRLFSFSLGDESLHYLSDVAEAYLITQLGQGFFTLDFYKSLHF